MDTSASQTGLFSTLTSIAPSVRCAPAPSRTRLPETPSKSPPTSIHSPSSSTSSLVSCDYRRLLSISFNIGFISYHNPHGGKLHEWPIYFAVGIWYIMWSNVGNISEHRSSLDFLPASRRDSINSSVSNDDNTTKPNAFLVSLFSQYCTIYTYILRIYISQMFLWKCQVALETFF